jgi:phage recombination protein Bet
MSAKFSLDPKKFLEVVKGTIFQRGATDEELIAFLTVANRYNLDPFRKEIYAFPQDGKIVPVVGIDGWARIANDNPAYDGCEFEFEHDEKGELVSIEARIYRKDRTHPTCVREYLAECRRNTPPWNNMKHRMLRHRGYIQGIRLALGVSGIMDEDEYEQWVEHNSRGGSVQRPRTLSDLTKSIRLEPGAVETPVTDPSSSADLGRHETPTPTPPQAPAVEAPGDRLYDLIGEAREFEEWALESENVQVWTRLCSEANVNPQNLKSGGLSKMKPFVESIRAWRRAQHAAQTETIPATAPTATAAPAAPVAEHQPSPGFHAECWALRASMPNETFNALVLKHGGKIGIMNYGLETERQRALLAELRAISTSVES